MFDESERTSIINSWEAISLEDRNNFLAASKRIAHKITSSGSQLVLTPDIELWTVLEFTRQDVPAEVQFVLAPDLISTYPELTTASRERMRGISTPGSKISVIESISGQKTHLAVENIDLEHFTAADFIGIIVEGDQAVTAENLPRYLGNKTPFRAHTLLLPSFVSNNPLFHPKVQVIKGELVVTSNPLVTEISGRK